MKITILCSAAQHPINGWLQDWIRLHGDRYEIELVRQKSELSGGDLLFMISCSEILEHNDRQTYKKSLVIHASDLPEGRGWSPHIWQILEGRTEIMVSLLEAADKVDTGDIWHQIKITIPRDALHVEINKLLFDAELELMNFAVSNFNNVVPRPQKELEGSRYYPKRSPQDSELDPDLGIADQFDLMRVCDPARFPAFFRLRGRKYKITLEKMVDE